MIQGEIEREREREREMSSPPVGECVKERNTLKQPFVSSLRGPQLHITRRARRSGREGRRREGDLTNEGKRTHTSQITFVLTIV